MSVNIEKRAGNGKKVWVKRISCICALGTAPPVSASETSAEGTECTDEEKFVYADLVVLRGINNKKG